MFKMKNLKILLLLLLFAFAGNDAWAGGGGGTDYWYYSNAKVETVPTGAGKVYAGKQNNAANPNNCVDAPHVFDGKSHKSQFPYNWYLNTIPTDSKKYKFLRWEDGNGNVISTDQNPQNSFKDNEGVKGEGNNTGESGDGATNPGTITMNFIAVYEEIINQYVSVESQNATYLTATIDKPENELGDEVTLWAYPNNYNSKFTGWSKDGEIVSMENPWTFTIDADNAGTYMATYKTGYNFYRFRNKETSRRFDAINDQGSISNFSSLQLVTGDVATYSAGSVIQIDMHHISGGDVYDYIMQGSHTSSYYNESAGEYMTMSLNSGDNTWNINPNRQKAYMADEGGANVSSSPYNDLDKSKWYIDPIDKDLETCENYFSLDPNPNKLVEVDGKYYTTLRTSWNILFNPDQMTPYIVKSVNETEGTFEMEPITGNIIPAGTPVIIETNSNDVEENRMVPTLTNAANGAVPSGNQLVSSVKYFPNQPAPVSNCKGLYKNANGQLAFGGNALSTVNGNEAYLSVANEVVKIETLPLSEIEQVGVKNRKYIVEDQLVVIYADIDEGRLWCKDQGNKSIAKTEKQDGQIDYMREITKEQKKDWDQSNWVMLQFEQPAQNSDLENLLKTATGKYIEPASIKGTYSDINNFTITMANQTLKLIDGGEPYVKNLYCPANFLPKNLNINGGEGAEGIYHGEPAHYFFMNPKVQEVCEITYAEWDGDNLFIVPLPTAENPTQNDSQIDGAFTVDWTYNVLGPNPPNLLEGAAYKFYAVVQRTQNSGYLKANEPSLEPSGDFIIYPLNLNPNENNDYNNVITAIGGVQTGKTVTRVVYYNLMGVESDVPHPGINIVETRYSDGSRSVVKVMK